MMLILTEEFNPPVVFTSTMKLLSSRVRIDPIYQLSEEHYVDGLSQAGICQSLVRTFFWNHLKFLNGII